MSPQFRYQKRPGFLGNLVRLNISQHGFSVSIGMPGMGITIPITGKHRRKSSIHAGIPGTGISVREQID